MAHQDEALDLLDVLLMRVVDGEASDEERDQLLALAGSDVRLVQLSALQVRLRDALTERTDDAIEVVGEVMAALMLDDGWDATSDLLRAGVGSLAPAAGLQFDIASAVMDAVAPAMMGEADVDADLVRLSALHDGELGKHERLALVERLGATGMADLTDWAEIGRHLRDAIEGEHTAQDISGMWAPVAKAIGIEDPEYVPGWEPLAAELKAAVAERVALPDSEYARITEAVMAELPAPDPVVIELDEPEYEADSEPVWRQLLANPLMFLAAFAAMLLAVVVADKAPVDEAAPSNPIALAPDVPEVDLRIAVDNDAEIEELEYAEQVAVQIIQFEEGAPMFLMIDEGEEGATL